MECKHEDVKTRFCSTCGERIVVDDAKKLDQRLTPVITDNILVILDDAKLPTETDRKAIYSQVMSTNDRLRNISRESGGIERIYRHGIGCNYAGGRVVMDTPFAIISIDVTYRQLFGEIANRKVTVPVTLTTDGKTCEFEFAYGKLSDYLRHFREDLWFNPSDKWVGTFSEVCGQLPGINRTKITAISTTRIGPVRVHYLPAWYDDIRDLIRHMRTLILYNSIKD